MQVREVMSANPACCVPNTSLQTVAELMRRHDCGAIPVVENEKSKKPVGIVTDRDITCRLVAAGKNPVELVAQDCMSDSVATVREDTDMEACCQTMEDKQLRRMVVVDAAGQCCGILSQADVAEHAPAGMTAEVVKEVSRD